MGHPEGEPVTEVTVTSEPEPAGEPPSGVAFAAGAAANEAEHAGEAAEEAEQTAEAAQQVAEMALDVASSVGGEAIEAQLDAGEALDATADLAARVTALEEQLAAGAAAPQATAEPTAIEVEPNADQAPEQRSEESGSSAERVGEAEKPKRRSGFRGRR